MARKPRTISKSGIYFVYLKPVSGIKLFNNTDNFTAFIKFLSECSKKYTCSILSYCLNYKNAYLMIKEYESGQFSLFMRRLLSSYALYYNKNNSRSGSVTADRFKSIPIETVSDCINVSVFIHQNAETEYSSLKEYINQQDGICDTSYILQSIADTHITAVYKFQDMLNRKSEFNYEPKTRQKLSDEKIIKVINKYADIEMLKNMPKEKRNNILKNLRTKENLSIGEIQRLTGISRGIITRAYNSKKTIKNIDKKKSIPDTTNYKIRNDVITEKITEKKEEIWLL